MDFFSWLFLLILIHLMLFLYVFFGERYLPKLVIHHWVGSVMTVFLLIPMVFHGKHVQNLRYPRAGLKLLAKLFRIKFKVHNFENVDIEEPCILVSNHQSSLDLFSMSYFMPENCAILVKKELRWAGPFGLMSQLCDSLYVDRFNSEKAKATIAEAVGFIHSKRLKVLVFPEGTRNSQGGLLPFKKGAFNLAVQAQIPIVPIVVSSYRSFLRPEENVLTKGNVSITCLPPVSTKGLTTADVPELSDKIRENMLQVLHQL